MLPHQEGSNNMNRRTFLKTGGATAGLYAIKKTFPFLSSGLDKAADFAQDELLGLDEETGIP